MKSQNSDLKILLVNLSYYLYRIFPKKLTLIHSQTVCQLSRGDRKEKKTKENT